MRDEIWAGLKNAIERGQTLEQAIQSFINAGYNAAEVREAATAIGEGASNIANSNREGKKNAPASQTASSNLSSVQVVQGDNTPQLAVKDIPTDSKVLYVPTQPEIIPKIEKSNKDYIPYEGMQSTRRKRLIILVSFLIFLVILLLLALKFYQNIIDLIKNFFLE